VPAARRFLTNGLHQNSRAREGHLLRSAQSVLRAHAAYLAQHGSALDQPEFLAISDTLTEAETYNLESEEDPHLGRNTLVALLARGLPLHHPVVQHYVTHPQSAYRGQVANFVSPATPEGRALLVGLRNDPVAWVRRVVAVHLPVEAHPPCWQGIFARDPNTLPDAAERAAALRIAETLTAAPTSGPLPPTRPLPDLDALSATSLLDLARTALMGIGVTRAEAAFLFAQCLERDLAPALVTACWASWSAHPDGFYPITRQLETLRTWAPERRAATQLALAHAFATVLEQRGDDKLRAVDTSLLTHENPWTLAPDPWIDAVLAFAERPATQPLARALGRSIAAEHFPAARRDALLDAWLRGHPAPMAFAGHDTHLGRLVKQLPRAEARALCARALRNPSENARAWAIDASLSDLYEDTDGARDDIALGYLRDDLLRPLAESRHELVKWFTRPLRRALVAGTLRDAEQVRCLILALAIAHEDETFGEDFWAETSRKTRRRAAEATPTPLFVEDGPLTAEEWAAIRVVRATAWSAQVEALRRPSWALCWFPTRPASWTDDDHTFFAQVLAQSQEEAFHNRFETPVLAHAMLSVWRPDYAPFARDFVAHAEEFARHPDTLAAVRAALAAAGPVALRDNHDADDNDDDNDDDWDDL